MLLVDDGHFDAVVRKLGGDPDVLLVVLYPCEVVQDASRAVDVEHEEEAELEETKRKLHVVCGVHIGNDSGQPQNSEELQH